jgi:hypothetical protein
MNFSHPLARSASVFTATNNDGSEYRVLAIVTTLELDPRSHNYKKPFIEKLSKAATDYLADSNKAVAFVFMNRPRDWLDRSSSEEGARGRATTGRNLRAVSQRRMVDELGRTSEECSTRLPFIAVLKTCL